ncbi:MAG: hypothetical protein ACR2Q3_17145 [Woeseiaceae bacterium]
MDVSRIVRLVAVLFAVVAGLVTIPAAEMIIAILGLIGGYFIVEERRTSFMVMTLTLALVHGALTPIPTIGIYLTDVLAHVSALLNAAACTVIVMSIIDRLKT